MIRLATLFWLLAVSAAGFAMFAVKYEVQSLADQLARAVRQTHDTERDIRVLDAEWAYLNRPDTLAELNRRFLSLVPIATKQLRASVADLPMRPPPPAPPEVVVADGDAVAGAASASQNPPAQAAQAPLDVTPPGPAPSAASSSAAPPAPTAQIAALSSAASSSTALPAPTAQIAALSARRAPVKAASRPSPAHRARSLDELIAQIAENRE